MLLYTSDIPREMKESIMAGDVDNKNLQDAVEKTKIKKILEQAGKHYYCLKPMWASSMKLGTNRRTRHPVIFFLNPWEQKINNSGWFTVEELKQWAKGKGPVLKT